MLSWFHSLSHSDAPELGQNRQSKRLQREVADFQSLLTAEEEGNDLDGYQVPDSTHNICLDYDWRIDGSSDDECCDSSDESDVEEEYCSQTPAPQAAESIENDDMKQFNLMNTLHAVMNRAQRIVVENVVEVKPVVPKTYGGKELNEGGIMNFFKFVSKGLVSTFKVIIEPPPKNCQECDEPQIWQYGDRIDFTGKKFYYANVHNGGCIRAFFNEDVSVFSPN
ncbi:hypothetical protein HK100_003127 [Physocladia obscura]|uniref:Uncharacterized protein n=1 Tax=Physocladia obscura TaxID=109957 RepID=A0AAD5SWK2_9FUNG|nr:hypothetical protein HK100_003127 [Physocladia obscura]